MERNEPSVPEDPCSFSRPDEVIVTHIHLNLEVDFNKQILTGEAIITANRRKEGKYLILDTSELNIKDVRCCKTGKVLKYNLASPDTILGSKLEIHLLDSLNEIFNIKISYDTSPKATALQWLTPEQTVGKKHPYLFCQCQPIHARSMLPCQDTPSVKMPYSATITAPSELVVLMGAIRDGEPVPTADGLCTHKFHQDVPIPSYLIAIAVGAVVSKKIGPRSHVWSEEELVNEAAYEFAETEEMLATAESICGPYVWGIYDLLILPPSFPLGAMEYPCLTFVTPTCLAGDRSLHCVIAHEISHSWTGNLVTNANYEHFWLNEGFTVFLERKILGRLFKPETRLFEAFFGLKDLGDAIKAAGENDPLTSLVVKLENVHPDEIFSLIPYEKGHTFLFYLEELVGGPDNFNPFIKHYLDKFKYKSIVTDDFKKCLLDYFPSNEKIQQVDWDVWLYKTGMPTYIPNYHTKMAEVCTNLTQKWVNWSGDGPSPFSREDLENMAGTQVMEFLAQLLLEDPLPVYKLKAMEKAYGFNSVKNLEIKFRWLRLGIRGKWTDQIPRVLEMVTYQGRMKFIRPLYRGLFEWPEARERAIETFKKNAASLMYVSAYTVTQDLHLTEIPGSQ